jgi:hypothetical protein
MKVSGGDKAAIVHCNRLVSAFVKKIAGVLHPTLL